MPALKDVPGDVKRRITEYLSMEDCGRLSATSQDLRAAMVAMLDQTFERRLSEAAGIAFGWQRANALAWIGWAFDRLPHERQTSGRKDALASVVNRTSAEGQADLYVVAGNSKAVGIIQQLLAHGARVDAANQYGRTALHWAAQRGNATVVQLLLGYGARVDAMSQYGRMALHEAAQDGHVAVVQLLLDHGAKVDATSQNGRTALHEAAQHGHATVVQLLLDRDAQMNAVDPHGRAALNLAVQYGHSAVAQQLRAHLPVQAAAPQQAPVTAGPADHALRAPVPLPSPRR